MAATNNSIKYQFNVGQKFGKWRIINSSLDKSDQIRVECRCECGAIKKVLAYKLVKKQTSGCFNCVNVGKHSRLWKGYEDLPGSYIASTINDAKKRNIIFKVTPKYLWELYIKQNSKCALSGIPIEFGTHNKARILTKRQTASLDRIDSKKGYVKGNLQWVHKDVNIMKNHFDQPYFIDICRKIIDNA